MEDTAGERYRIDLRGTGVVIEAADPNAYTLIIGDTRKPGFGDVASAHRSALDTIGIDPAFSDEDRDKAADLKNWQRSTFNLFDREGEK